MNWDLVKVYQKFSFSSLLLNFSCKGTERGEISIWSSNLLQRWGFSFGDALAKYTLLVPEEGLAEKHSLDSSCPSFKILTWVSLKEVTTRFLMPFGFIRANELHK